MSIKFEKKEKEVIKRIAEETKLEEGTVSEVFTGAHTAMVNDLGQGNEFPYPGVGTFKPKHRAAREVSGINPQTKEPLSYTIPEKTVIHFKIKKDVDAVLNPALFPKKDKAKK